MSATYTTFPTAFGPCSLAATERGVSAVELPVFEHEAPAVVSARMEARGAAAAAPSPLAQRAVAVLQRFFAGEVAALTEVPLDLASAPAFHQRVYQALQAVGKGQVVSYQELAERSGSPGAVRAVGQAMAKNPCPILIPCHRVLAAGGKLGGFSAAGGTQVKCRLLVLEGARTREELLAQADPRLGRLMKKVGPFPLGDDRKDSIFETLARSIAYQQLAGKAAATIWGRVKALLPGGVTAEAVRRTDPAALRGAGLSANKTAAILDLAEKALSGVVPEEAALAPLADAEIVKQLTQVRGIGPWSVEMLLMFRLGRLDVLPVSDYGVRKGFQILYGLPELPTPAELLAHGERWRPYRSIGSWYMWRVLELDKPAAAAG